MKINIETITRFNPCKDRLDNYLSYYSQFDGSLSEFLNLDKITFRDKVWISVRLMTRTQKVKFSILCAESVLHIFEFLQQFFYFL